MNKKLVSILLSVVILLTSVMPSFAFAEDEILIKREADLLSALKTDNSYALNVNLRFSNYGISGNVKLDGKGKTLYANNPGSNAMLYQNDYAVSSFSNVIISGTSKRDVGIWLGNGEMSFTDSTIKNFNITDGRYSAIGMIGSTKLTLNNTILSNNRNLDVVAYDFSTINVNKGTQLNNLRIASRFVTLNIGDDWSGSFSLSFENPVQKVIGTVGKGADISRIKVTNNGYHLENVDGKLVVIKENETAIRFDMSKREKLYKGSTGFLYGESEINVPTIDLLQGLKPDTMVQKAVGGLQHPTGDAVRTRSALVSAGVRDMQIYLQDNYLEWPYDAPMKDGQIDIDGYQKTVEKIVRQMICDSKGNVDASIAKKYSFVLFNEPDQIWFRWNLEGLEQAWKQIYDAVHKIYPDARCVGPNFSGFDADRYDKFLAFCAENDCLPEIISWHELGDISLIDFEEHYNSVVSDVEKYYPEGKEPELMVNEYARHYDIGSAGGIVKWLAMFEDKDMSGCMAYWAMANSLNEMAADQNSPTSTWWVYHWYAQMTGEQCPLTYPSFKETRFYGVASYDERENIGYTIFGGSEDEDMAEVVYADNLDSTDLLNKNGAVNVKIYGVGFSGQHGANYKPEVIFDSAVQTESGTLRISLENTDEMEAYFAVLTKPSDDAEVKEIGNASISTLSYEAENAKLLGNAMAYSKLGWATFTTSGRADVGSINNNNSGVEFEVKVAEDGIYNASLFYSLQAPYVNPQTLEPKENGQNRGIGKSLPYGMFVDGKRLDDITLESTVVWWYKNHADVEIPLTAGKHTIKYMHINGDESQRGNLQLSAALDKLDLTKIDTATKNDFEIDLTEMSSFKTENGYEITAVAPVSGYYEIKANANVSFTKQAVDYATDAKTTSECSTYDIPVGSTVYLSQGANTIGVIGNATKLEFIKADDNVVTIFADEITLHGNVPEYKANKYAKSQMVISELGVGQSGNEKYTQNYAYFDIEAEADGYYNLAIRYSNDEPAPVMLKANGETYIHPYNIDLVERYMQIVVNDSEPETAYFRNTMSWDSFKVLDVQVMLKKGINRIKLYNDNSYQFSSLVNSTAPEIDEIKISSLTYNGTAVKKVEKTTTQKHNFIETERVDPGCAKTGNAKYICSECGYSKSVTLEPTGIHDFVSSKVTTNATCAKKGVRTYYCSNCSATKTEAISATGKHTFANPKVTKAPTSSKAGEMTYTCKNCTKTKKEPITKLVKASINKVSPLKKGFKVTWKKTSNTTGYRIQYSTSNKFKNPKYVTVTKSSTVSKTVSSIKGNQKYYVRIQTYRTINGKKYFSAWSGYKTVKTK